MKRPIVLGIVAVIAMAAVWFVYRGTDEESRIRREISEANYCTTSADCQVVTAQCPFGCWAAVNKNEAARIEARIAGYQSTCVYSCIQQEGVECVAGSCRVIVDEPGDSQ